VVVGDEMIPWPVSQRDIDDETESMVPRLAALGLGEGGLVLIVSLLSDTIHVYPFEQAAGRLGALYSSADRSPFDAFPHRVADPPAQATVVMGIDHRVLDGLTDAGRDLYEVFAPVPAVVAVDDDAATRLAATGSRYGDGSPSVRRARCSARRRRARLRPHAVGDRVQQQRAEW
jgi:hypothetical protein